MIHSITNPLHQKHDAGNGDRIAERLIAGRIGRIRDIRPSVRKALQPLALQRDQTANKLDRLLQLLHHIHNEVGRILMLPGAFCRSNMIRTKRIDSLTGK